MGALKLTCYKQNKKRYILPKDITTNVLFFEHSIYYLVLLLSQGYLKLMHFYPYVKKHLSLTENKQRKTKFGIIDSYFCKSVSHKLLAT